VVDPGLLRADKYLTAWYQFIALADHPYPEFLNAFQKGEVTRLAVARLPLPHQGSS